jgi:chromosome segregation ATPase
MNGELTEDLNGSRPFEERVFARFDGIESYLRSLDGRVQVLESRSHDTKPIWERALKEILETKSRIEVIETNLAGVKTEVAAMKTDYSGIRTELLEMKRELKHQVNKRLDLILKFLLEDRDDTRDAEDRIRQLESTVGIVRDPS